MRWRVLLFIYTYFAIRKFSGSVFFMQLKKKFFKSLVVGLVTPKNAVFNSFREKIPIPLLLQIINIDFTKKLSVSLVTNR